jgi:hypothetical protein
MLRSYSYHNQSLTTDGFYYHFPSVTHLSSNTPRKPSLSLGRVLAYRRSGPPPIAQLANWGGA